MSPNLKLLAFGAHPDDLEFGAGGVLALHASLGHSVHLVIGSRGEAATHGTPEQREGEARRAAQIIGASIEFIDLGGDAHFEAGFPRVLQIARLLRQHRPDIVLAPTLDGNQHPDHAVLARLVRDAARLARFGGLAELKDLPPHAISSLFHYAITSDTEESGPAPLWIDVSPVLAGWTEAMQAHASQAATRDYVDLQLTKARLLGAKAGVGHAQALWPADPLVVSSLAPLAKTARRF